MSKFVSHTLFIVSFPILVLAQNPFNTSNELHPSWSPDGSWVCFQSDRNGNDDIYALHLKSKELIQLTKSDSTDAGPVWSKDGKYIVFESGRNGNPDIYYIDWVTRQVSALSKKNVSEIHPTFIEDNIVIYSANIDGYWQLFKADLDGNNEQVTFGRRDHLSPNLSTERNKILYSVSYPGKHQDQIEIEKFDLINKKSTPITSNSSISSNASTVDNSDIIVFNTKRQGNWDIYKMQKDGKNQKALTSNKDPKNSYLFMENLDGQPALSPNRDQIAFASGRSGDFNIWIMDTHGENLMNLTSGWTKANSQ